MFDLKRKVTVFCWFFKKGYLKVLPFLEADLGEKKIQDHFKSNTLIQHSIYNLL